MFQIGGGFLKRIMGHFHNVLEAAQVSLVHASYLARKSLFIADFLQLKQPSLRAAPEDDTHFIISTQSAKNALRTISRDLISVGELHSMHDQDDRAAWQ